MKGYRADTYSQVERLVFMAFYERAHAVFCRNLEAQIDEPVLNGLVGRIARDEERHEEFFANLVAHLPRVQPRRDDRGRSHAAPPSSTSSAPTSTPTRTRCSNVADAGIFDDADAAPGDLRPHRRVGPRRRAELRHSSTPKSLRG